MQALPRIASPWHASPLAAGLDDLLHAERAVATASRAPKAWSRSLGLLRLDAAAAGQGPPRFTAYSGLPHAPTQKYARSLWSRALLPDAEGPRSTHSPLDSSAAGADHPPGPCCGKKFLNRRDHANYCRRVLYLFIRHVHCASVQVVPGFCPDFLCASTRRLASVPNGARPWVNRRL